MEEFIVNFEKRELINSYLDNNIEMFNELVKKYPEFNHIDIFIKIAQKAFEMFSKYKMCSFEVEGDDFFSLIDCTFKGYNDIIYIYSEDPNINNYPFLMYDRSCMIYIEIPKDFDEDPDKYKEEFIKDTIFVVAENYIKIKKEDELGLLGKTLLNPDYIEK